MKIFEFFYYLFCLRCTPNQAKLLDKHLTVYDAANQMEENGTENAIVYMNPPKNANQYMTDEDSSPEDDKGIDGLNVNVLQADAEITLNRGYMTEVKYSILKIPHLIYFNIFKTI
jgi:hypothetical protein